MKRHYFIDGDTNQRFASLEEVRNHIDLQTDNDREGYNGMYVMCDEKEDFCRTIIIKNRKVILSNK